MAETDLARPAFRYSSAGRRPERLNQSRNVNAPLQLARGWAAGLLGLPGDIEGLVRLLPGLDETPRLPTSDFYREYLPGYDPRPAARAMSGLGALTGGAGATSVVRGGLGAVKRATDLNAIRDYVRSAQGLSGLPGTAVVKPKGGNWLKGPGSPEDTVQALKVRDRYGMTDPTELSAALGIPLEEAQALHASNAPNAALNQWLDQKLAKYIRNEMGTPEDPLRALVQERGISHLTEDDLMRSQAWVPDDLAERRVRAGFPEEGMAERLHAERGWPRGGAEDRTRMAAGWEAEADRPIDVWTAGSLLDDMHLRENPWLAKVPPETPVYSIENAEQTLRTDLGFDHLVDELRNATRAGTDLPRELQLRPEQLSKVTMPQAVELVDRINKWRAAQKVEADLARSTNIATFEHKAYPEQGYKWVELRSPEFKAEDALADMTESERSWFQRYLDKGDSPQEAFKGAVGNRLPMPGQKALEDALQYEADVMGHCVGRYCPDIMEGRSRIFSLRDAKGQPHVTVEVTPKRLNNWDDVTAAVGEEKAKQLWAEFDALGGYKAENAEQVFNQLMQERGVQPLMDIKQIKGKGNRAPKDEYLPYVQDFVKSQRWGRIGDAQNTGMRQTREVFNFNELQMLKRLGEDYIPDVLTGEDIQRLHNMIVPEGRRLKYDARGNVVGSEEPGYARGGVVSAGPAQYDPARISALADQLLMEA